MTGRQFEKVEQSSLQCQPLSRVIYILTLKMSSLFEITFLL